MPFIVALFQFFVQMPKRCGRSNERPVKGPVEKEKGKQNDNGNGKNRLSQWRETLLAMHLGKLPKKGSFLAKMEKNWPGSIRQSADAIAIKLMESKCPSHPPTARGGLSVTNAINSKDDGLEMTEAAN